MPGHHTDGMRSELLVFRVNGDEFIEHRIIDVDHNVPRSKVGVQVFVNGIDVELFGDITAVSTALPVITHDLNGGDKFVWVGAAYALAAAATIPFTGHLANIFGRRPTMVGCIGFFFLGSALSGSAKNINWLISARRKFISIRSA